MQANCPFCTSKLIDNQRLFSTDHFHVVFDNTPIRHGHLLILPKTHKKNRAELNHAQNQDLFYVHTRINTIFMNVFKQADFLAYEKNGVRAGQNSEHFMIHIIPSSSKWDLLWTQVKLFLRTLGLPFRQIKDFTDLRKEFLP